MKRLKTICIILFTVWCVSMMNLSLVSAQRQRGVSEEEIKKMEEAMPTKAVVEPAKPRKLLVFNLCQGFRHSSIPYWDKALEIMGKKTGAFSVEFSSDLNVFKAESLGQFDAVCFNNTTDLQLTPEKTPEMCKSLMDFVKGGKGIVGIHAATDCFYKNNIAWPEASEMLGGKFSGHPWTDRGTWAIKIDEPNHPLMVPFKGKGLHSGRIQIIVQDMIMHRLPKDDAHIENLLQNHTIHKTRGFFRQKTF